MHKSHLANARLQNDLAHVFHHHVRQPSAIPTSNTHNQIFYSNYNLKRHREENVFLINQTSCCSRELVLLCNGDGILVNILICKEKYHSSKTEMGENMKCLLWHLQAFPIVPTTKTGWMNDSLSNTWHCSLSTLEEITTGTHCMYVENVSPKNDLPFCS